LTKITKLSVDALQPKRQPDGDLVASYLWDAELKGFGCKVTPAGRKVYLVQYRLGGRAGKTQRVTLGVHGEITADQARRRAKTEFGRIADGQDPAQDQRDKKKKLATGSFKEVCERYLATAGKGNKSWFETRRLLEHDAIPALGKRPIAALSRGEIALLVDAIAARSPAVGRAVFAALRPMFKWCLDRGIIASNPIADLKGPAPVASRDRVLDVVELQAFWRATQAFDWPFGPLLRLLLLTGQRRAEVAGMNWQEIDAEKRLWIIPRERTKNGVEHIVDLSPQALAVLYSLPSAGRSDPADNKSVPFQFPRNGLIFSTTGETSVSGFSKAKRRLDAVMAQHLPDGDQPTAAAESAHSLKPWRLHDLRRTMATLMGEELAVDPGVIERVLNHISGSQGGLQGVYQRQQYRQKRKEALISWGAFVEQLIGTSPSDQKVVALAEWR
jgi:integrase